MNLQFKNMPQTKDFKDFEAIFMAALEPLKNHIQYNNLQGRLTEEDLHLLAHALMAGCYSWCEFLRQAELPHNRN